MKCHVTCLALFILLAMVGWVTPARANAALSLLDVFVPATSFFFFIPIVLIEWLRVQIDLPNVQNLFRKIIFANVVSTLLGVPLTWLVLLVVKFVLGGNLSHQIFNMPENIWNLFGRDARLSMIFLVFEFLFAIIPFFLASYWIETLVMRQCISTDQASKEAIKKAVWRANIYSYLFLISVNTILATF